MVSKNGRGIGWQRKVAPHPHTNGHRSQIPLYIPPPSYTHILHLPSFTLPRSLFSLTPTVAQNKYLPLILPPSINHPANPALPERKQALEALDTTNPHKLKRPGATLATPSTTAGGIKSSTIASSATTRGAGLKPSGPSTTSGVIPDEYLPPNKILFLRELPESYDAERLSAIFASFEGFKEVRTVPNRKGIAFVEYEGEQGAISAKEATGGMQLEDKRIRVTYQRQ